MQDGFLPHSKGHARVSVVIVVVVAMVAVVVVIFVVVVEEDHRILSHANDRRSATEKRRN